MLPRFWRFWLVLLIAFAIAAILPSCKPSQFVKSEAQVSQMVISNLSDPKTFNAALSDSYPNVFIYISEGLVTTNGQGELEPALAEKWEISEDKQRLVFTLRPGLKWSDGEPLTADDVVFTYNDIYLNEAIPTGMRDILRIGESRALPTIKKLDNRRIEFTTPEPFAPFLRTTGASILPAHILRKTVISKDREGNPKFLTTWGIDTDPQKIVSNGPYQLESYVTSERVVFRRNPYYWRKDDRGNSQPYIERLVWQLVESTDTALLKFRSGGLDRVVVSPNDFSLLKREEARGDFTIYNGGPAAGTTFISFNLNQGRRDGKPLVDPIKSRWFNILAFRKAVAYAIDRQAMIDTTFRGLGELQNSPISVQSPFYSEDLPVYNYNPAKARALLRSAGFEYNEQGQLLDRDGNRIRFTLITNAGNKRRESMGAQIKQDLGRIGIQVDFNPLAFNVLVDKLTNSLDWECHLLGFTGGVEPNNGANIWSPEGRLHSFNQKPAPGQPPLEGQVVAPWEKEIGRLFIQGARELDEQKRRTIYAETQRLAQEQLPYIHLVNPFSMAAVRDRVEGIKYSALGGTAWNIYEQRIKDQQQGLQEMTE